MSTMVCNKDSIFSHLPSQGGLEVNFSTPIPVVSSQQEVREGRSDIGDFKVGLFLLILSLSLSLSQNTNTSAQIHTEQAVLDDLQNEVERLNQTLNEERGVSWGTSPPPIIYLFYPTHTIRPNGKTKLIDTKTAFRISVSLFFSPFLPPPSHSSPSFFCPCAPEIVRTLVPSTSLLLEIAFACTSFCSTWNRFLIL